MHGWEVSISEKHTHEMHLYRELWVCRRLWRCTHEAPPTKSTDNSTSTCTKETDSWDRCLSQTSWWPIHLWQSGGLLESQQVVSKVFQKLCFRQEKVNRKRGLCKYQARRDTYKNNSPLLYNTPTESRLYSKSRRKRTSIRCIIWRYSRFVYLCQEERPG